MVLNCLRRFCFFSILLITRYVSGQSIGCPERTGRWPDPVQCDAYIECSDGIGERKLCPDGLVFALDKYYGYPCVYPQEADCTARPNLQTPQPTAECPHQFGVYSFGDTTTCGKYLTCSNGQAFIQDCPEGLAFNEEIMRCDWPDLVLSCSVEAYLGFSCPPPNPHPYYGTKAGYDYYRSPSSCDRYFICLDGKPRLLLCSSGYLFDTDTNSCLPAQNVTSCYSTSSRSNLNQQGFQSNPYNPNAFSSNDYFS